MHLISRWEKVKDVGILFVTWDEMYSLSLFLFGDFRTFFVWLGDKVTVTISLCSFIPVLVAKDLFPLKTKSSLPTS